MEETTDNQLLISDKIVTTFDSNKLKQKEVRRYFLLELHC